MKRFPVRLTTLLLAVAVVSLSFTIPSLSSSRKQNRKNAQQGAQTGGQQLAGINGADTPDLIPEAVAYEFFLRSLVPDPAEGAKARERVRSFAMQVTQDETEIYELLFAAQNFERRVAELDKQVKQIKDASWPRPSRAVMNQLAELQRQKEALIQEALNALTARLDENDAKKPIKDKRGAEKVKDYIAGRVKRGITAVVPPLPTGHDHPPARAPLRLLFGAFLGLASFAPAMQRMGEGYTYSNVSYDLSYEQIFGYGATAESYSSYGHTYQLTSRLYLEDGRQVSTTAPYVGGYASPYLQTQTLSLPIIDPTTLLPYDRFAGMETRGTIRCPYAIGAIFYMIASYAQQQLPAQVRIEEVTAFNPTCISSNENSSSNFNIIVSASSRVPNPTTVEVEAVRITPPPPALSTDPESGNKSQTVTPNSLTTFTFEIKHSGTNQEPGEARYRARIISVAENDPDVLTQAGGNPIERPLQVRNPCQ
jgi:hypothetical protein